jgi:hypothetical protein
MPWSLPVLPHDEQKNDGEYILLTKKKLSGIKFPKTELGIKILIKNSSNR